VSFFVSPGINERVVEAVQEHSLPITPGVVSPSEVERARALGCRLLKFFPAEAAGGVKMLKALAGPYGHTGLKFVPTGGINSEKAPEYAALPTVAAVGGSWFVDKKLLATKNFGKITELTREALQLVRG
jgi:2-dehydro-3-deoxyphosphogluconate aldolase/(4S)-4-hydroxy-2-oxoglutarate aldolase